MSFDPVPEKEQRDKIETIFDALLAATDFFKYRDCMNGEVHCQAPRFSPITDLCESALIDFRTLYDCSEFEPLGGVSD